MQPSKKTVIVTGSGSGFGVRFSRTSLLTLLLLIGGVTGCIREPEIPDRMISESTYQDLLVEVFLSQYLVELEEMNEQQRDSMLNALFQHYELTQDEFDRIHTYYQRDPVRQLERIDEIRHILNEEREALQEGREELLNRRRQHEQNREPGS